MQPQNSDKEEAVGDRSGAETVQRRRVKLRGKGLSCGVDVDDPLKLQIDEAFEVAVGDILIKDSAAMVIDLISVGSSSSSSFRHST